MLEEFWAGVSALRRGYFSTEPGINPMDCAELPRGVEEIFSLDAALVSKLKDILK